MFQTSQIIPFQSTKVRNPDSVSIIHRAINTGSLSENDFQSTSCNNILSCGSTTGSRLGNAKSSTLFHTSNTPQKPFVMTPPSSKKPSPATKPQFSCEQLTCHGGDTDSDLDLPGGNQPGCGPLKPSSLEYLSPARRNHQPDSTLQYSKSSLNFLISFESFQEESVFIMKKAEPEDFSNLSIE